PVTDGDGELEAREEDADDQCEHMFACWWEAGKRPIPSTTKMRAIAVAALSGLVFVAASVAAQGDASPPPPLPADAAAEVGQAPISTSLLAHWERVARRSGSKRSRAR